jgi:hypothetical protein
MHASRIIQRTVRIDFIGRISEPYGYLKAFGNWLGTQKGRKNPVNPGEISV